MGMLLTPNVDAKRLRLSILGTTSTPTTSTRADGACRYTDGALLLGRGVIKPRGSLRLGRGIRWLDGMSAVWGANTGPA